MSGSIRRVVSLKDIADEDDLLDDDDRGLDDEMMDVRATHSHAHIPSPHASHGGSDVRRDVTMDAMCVLCALCPLVRCCVSRR